MSHKLTKLIAKMNARALMRREQREANRIAAGIITPEEYREEREKEYARWKRF